MSYSSLLDKQELSPNVIENDGCIRPGDPIELSYEFIKLINSKSLHLKHRKLLDPLSLDYENILSVHYADGGAQGEAGALRLLYHTPQGIQILYGNFVYGDLRFSDVIKKLPMLSPLDSSSYNLGSFPYPFGGKLEIPCDWVHLYMGAMNHHYLKREIFEEASEFINHFLNNSYHKSAVFDAIAWLYRVNPLPTQQFNNKCMRHQRHPIELAYEFIKLTRSQHVYLEYKRLFDLLSLDYENILGVHYTYEYTYTHYHLKNTLLILYRTSEGVQILHNTYNLEDLSCSDVIKKFPVLGSLVNSSDPRGGKLEIPCDWVYLHTGETSHNYLKREIFEEAREFINYFFNYSFQKESLFDAIAWLYGVDPIKPTSSYFS